MGRRVIVSRDQMYKNRASAWEFHYNNRNIARSLCSIGFDGGRISYILKDFCVRDLSMDGNFLDIPMQTRRQFEDSALRSCGLARTQTDLLCDLYWTQQGWLEFVRLWQALPEVEEAYYHVYDPLPNDRLLLVPVSSKPKQGSVPVDKCLKTVDNPVDKSGTSKGLKVQLGQKEDILVRRW